MLYKIKPTERTVLLALRYNPRSTVAALQAITGIQSRHQIHTSLRYLLAVNLVTCDASQGAPYFFSLAEGCK
jgi:hypothetical protein